MAGPTKRRIKGYYPSDARIQRDRTYALEPPTHDFRRRKHAQTGAAGTQGIPATLPRRRVFGTWV